MKYFFQVCQCRQIGNNLKKLVFLVFVFSSMFTLAESEDSPNNAVNLSSTTAKHSAAFHLGTLNDDEREKDMERLTIGVGETVTLTLSGKQVDKNTKVEWSYQGNGVTLSAKDQTATLQAAVSMVKESKVTVTAKTDLGSDNLTFTILCPTGVSGVFKRQLETNENLFGIKGEICVTISPISVSFNGLYVLEKDEGTVVVQRHKDLVWVGGSKHNPNPRSQEIDQKNQFTDGVEYLIGRSMISMDPRPLTPEQCIVKWYWKCAAHLEGEQKAMSHDNQNFEVIIGKDPKAEIRKFSATFTNIN